MLSHKVVLITGAAGRIGSALAKAVVQNHGQVVLLDKAQEPLHKLASTLPKESALPIVANAAIAAEVEAGIDLATQTFGRLDAAVHCAYPRSEGWGTPFEDLKAEFLAEDLSGQLGGAILFSQQILKKFKRQGHGTLIHVSSIQGIAAPEFGHYEGTSMVSPIEYSAIKAGIIALSRYLAKYYSNTGIRVNCVSPGGIFSNQPPSFVENYRHSCNQKGLLDPEDVTGAILFLLSDQARYMSGQNIVVDDGWSL
jgi:NAD(P)-dependent dehydrogenase (short-subunit alcohol dehydrogenase family)